MYDELRGKVAVITGGSSGIGSALVEGFSEEGCRTVNLDLNPAESSKGKFYRTDVSDEENVKASIRSIIEEFGRIDTVINNAGLNRTSAIHELELADWNFQLNVNLAGTFLMSKHSIPHMIRQGSGTIINISSVNGIMPEGKDSAYAASKAAILSLTRSIAVEYAPEIRSIAIVPGSVRTPAQERTISEMRGMDANALKNGYSSRSDAHPAGRIAEPGEIASVALFLASSGASFLNGSHIIVDGGLLSRNPASLYGRKSSR